MNRSRHRHGHYRTRGPEKFNPEDWWDRRRNGHGMNLYRNTRDQKIAGVCAGLADHFNVDHWVIRLAAVGGFFFFNTLMIFAYIGAWIALAPRPKGSAAQTAYRYDENLHQDRPVNMFRYQMSPSDRLRTARQRMDEVMSRVSTMERYVTSRRYELDKEFSKIDK
ncbi:MAG: PspC domain-containing protein [Reinekea sp.]|jgi:phage shock protein C|nr:PspC domain-containing protein [Reinekea sp.]MDX1474179.1 PspC domain-containing protein [Reinekea sp.]